MTGRGLLKTKIFWLLLIFAVVFQAIYQYNKAREGKELSLSENIVHHDLKQIRKKGKLVMLTNNSSTGYFVYRGEPMGFEYELMKKFTRDHDLELEVKLLESPNEVIHQLNRGEGDIIAANFTVTADRSRQLLFTDPLLSTRQVLVQRKPATPLQPIRKPSELVGKTIYVRKGSSYHQRLEHLAEEIGDSIFIVTPEGEPDPESLIEQVANGTIELTVADEYIARVNKTYYPGIDIGMPISFEQKIAWGVRKNSADLHKELNQWLKKIRKDGTLRILYNKYFENLRSAHRRIHSVYYYQRGGRLSPYDELLKQYAARMGWDWRLLAAQMYEESQFDPQARSWAGAFGVMQLMPSTAALFGADSTSPPEAQIGCAMRYMQYLDKIWKRHIPDSLQRICFVLASYNSGLGHVIDARNLARKYGKDPNTWITQVDSMLLFKSKSKYYTDPAVKFGYCRGEEPFYFVKDILARYEHYRNAVP